MVPNSPDALLPRKGAAAALSSPGLIVAPATLQTLASRGGRPPHRTFNRRASYRWGDALDWAMARLSNPRRCTSEGDRSQFRVVRGVIVDALT
jgi:hypothetical protein